MMGTWTMLGNHGGGRVERHKTESLGERRRKTKEEEKEEEAEAGKRGHKHNKATLWPRKDTSAMHYYSSRLRAHRVHDARHNAP